MYSGGDMRCTDMRHTGVHRAKETGCRLWCCGVHSTDTGCDGGGHRGNKSQAQPRLNSNSPLFTSHKTLRLGGGAQTLWQGGAPPAPRHRSSPTHYTQSPPAKAGQQPAGPPHAHTGPPPKGDVGRGVWREEQTSEGNWGKEPMARGGRPKGCLAQVWTPGGAQRATCAPPRSSNPL